MDFYYNGTWRMDWGLGNPNKTATLIACLMIAVWAIPMIWKRSFWPVLFVFTALAWCLVQTYSRGGMVSLLTGMGIMLLWIPRPWPKARWIGVVVSLWILGGFVLYAKAQTRYEQGLFTEDQSISHRIIIWRHFPEMVAAAPWGWGFGKAGDAYTQWFQPFTQSFNYLNLVNSHFTWMAEGGWLASVVYLFAWLTILLLCWPVLKSRLKALPLAIWVTFGVGGCFSHVEETFWLWILPLIALGYVIVERFRIGQWPKLSSFAVSGVASAAFVAAVILTGLATSSLPIRSSAGAVTIGRGTAQTFIFVDRQVMGSLFGHTFRKFLTQNPDQISTRTFNLVESSHELPSSGIACLVVSGRFTREGTVVSNLNEGKEVILVNPVCLPDDAKLNGLTGKTLVYFGEYSQAPSRSSWLNYPGIKALQIDGASDFVPSWPQAILMPHKI
jgi:O-Antigen ligase